MNCKRRQAEYHIYWVYLFLRPVAVSPAAESSMTFDVFIHVAVIFPGGLCSEAAPFPPRLARFQEGAGGLRAAVVRLCRCSSHTALGVNLREESGSRETLCKTLITETGAFL